MSNSSTINVALKIDDKGGVRVLQNVGKESASTGKKGKKAFNEMDRSAKSFTGSAKMSANTMLKMGAGVVGILGLAKAWGSLKSAASEYMDLASEQEAAERRLGSVLKATGEAAGYNLDQLKDMASGLQEVTRVGDETTLAGMAILATFKQVRGEAFERATVAAMDMAEVMGTDLNSNILQIGKALQDPVKGLTALTRVGVTFTEGQKETIKSLQASGDMMAAQNIILKELEGQFGGAAKAASQDFAGGLIQAQNALGDTKEEMGFVITKNQFFIELTHMATEEFKRWGDETKNNRGYLMDLAKDGVLMVVSSLKAGIETMRFFHNGWSGIKLVGQAAVQALAFSLDALYPIIRSLLAPLDALYQGMVKLGVMDVNPFDAIGEGLATFKDSSAQVTKDVLADINKTNEKYDTVSNTLQGYIDKIKKIPTAVAESAESEKAANNKRLDNLDQLGTAAEAITDKELKALQEANQKKYAMDIALANQIGDDTWLIREEGLEKALAQAEDAQTKMTQMEYDESQKRIKQQADAQDKALKELERAQQHMYDNIHDIIADFWGDALSGKIRDWEDFNDSMVRTFEGTTAELLATWTTGFGDKFNDILNSSVDAIKGMSGNNGASHPDGTREATKPSNFDWMKSIQYVGAIYSLADGLLNMTNEDVPPIKVVLDESSVLGAARGTGSQSIANSLANWEDIGADQYSELQGIYDEMKELNYNITGLATGIVRSFGDFSGVPAGVTLGTNDGSVNEAFGNFPSWMMGGTGDDLLGGLLLNTVGDVLDNIFGGTEHVSMQGAGLEIGAATVQSILDGADLTVQKWTQTLTYTEGGWFSDSSDTWNTYYEGVDSSITGLFTKVGQSVGEGLQSLDEYLGTAIDFSQVEIDLGTINLMGLEGSEITEKVNELISKTYDELTEQLFGSLYKSYQQIGEGFAETMIRLIGENSVIMNMLDKTNSSFDGTTQEAIAFSQSLISMSGDFKTLSQSFSKYYDSFFTDAEKQTDIKGSLASNLSVFDLDLPNTREAYRAAVEAVDLSTDAGKELYVTLIELAGTADGYYDYLKDMDSKTKSFNSAQDDIILKNSLSDYDYAFVQLYEWYDQQIETISKTGGSLTKVIEAFEIQRDAINQAEKDRISKSSMDAYENALKTEISLREQELSILEDNLNQARENYLAALDTEIEKQEDARDAAERSADTYRDLANSLKSGQTDILMNSGILNPAQETTLAKAEWEKTLQGAWQKDEDALKALPDMAQAYLETSQKTLDKQEYENLFGEVYRQLGTAEKIARVEAEKQTSIADLAADQLRSLEDQRLDVAGSARTLLSIDQAADEYHTASLVLEQSGLTQQIARDQARLDELKNLNTNVLSLVDAQLEYRKAEVQQQGGGGGYSFNEDIYYQNKLTWLNSNLDNPEIQAASQKYGNTGTWDLAGLKAAHAAEGLSAEQDFNLYGTDRGISPYASQKAGYADGGITSGPKSGYWELLHGTEAVIPLGKGSLPIIFQGGIGISFEPLISEIKLLRAAVEKGNEDDDKRHLETSSALQIIKQKVIIIEAVGIPEKKVS